MALYQTQIENYIDLHRQDMLDLWKELVNLEGQSKEKENLTRVAAFLKKEFEKTGMVCSLEPVGEQAGDYLIGTLGANRPGKPIVFSGHFDTVFAAGTYGEAPFRIEDGKAFGPGALDMKGGIIISLFVIKALNEIGFDERPIKICYVSDEEIGHTFSRGPEVIKREACGSLCCFNMETGLLDNALCIGRKACVGMDIVVTGVEAHSGNDFTAGRNAIAEMAQKIVRLEALTDLEEGSTVNCGVIRGGTVSNAIPGRCELQVSMRFVTEKAMEKTIAAAKAICEETFVAGTSTEMTYRVMMPAYETKKETLDFYEICKSVSEAYGYGTVGCRAMGGGSDAAYFTMMGVPAICSFGVRGENNHTAREYALVESLFERAKWITTICLHLGGLEQ